MDFNYNDANPPNYESILRGVKVGKARYISDEDARKEADKLYKEAMDKYIDGDSSKLVSKTHPW